MAMHGQNGPFVDMGTRLIEAREGEARRTLRANRHNPRLSGMLMGARPGGVVG